MSVTKSRGILKSGNNDEIGGTSMKPGLSVSEMEENILDKLSKGLLDGVVGDDFITGDHAKVTFRKVIKDGIPQIIRYGAGSKYFDGKENIHIDGKMTIEYFKSREEILKFIQKFGWLLADPVVKMYSALFKPKK